jgi:hypothetical protein
MIRGKCQLCHVTADLCDSHYMPKGTYKRNRASGLKSQHPVILGKGKARQSSVQIRDYQFCLDCEDRLNKGGERWVLKHLPETDKAPFPIHTILEKVTPSCSEPGLAAFRKADVPDIDFEKLTYFGMSIFWRGTLRWKDTPDGLPHRLHLGKHAESIRKFLLGRGKLPSEIHLVVSISPHKEVRAMALSPRPGEKSKTFWFHVNGITFMLCIGKDVPIGFRKTSINQAEVVVVSVPIQEKILNNVKKTFKTLDASSLDEMFKEIAEMKGKGSS